MGRVKKVSFLKQENLGKEKNQNQHFFAKKSRLYGIPGKTGIGCIADMPMRVFLESGWIVPIFVFGPPGCTTTRTVQRLNVLRTVRTTAVTTFRTTRISAGAFSGRPAPWGKGIEKKIQFRQPVGQSAALKLHWHSMQNHFIFR